MKSLLKARKEKGISQTDLLETTGLHHSNVSQIENGLVMPNTRTRRRLEAQFGPLDWITPYKIKKTKNRKIIEHDEIQVEFLKLMERIYLLQHHDNYYILRRMRNCITNFLKQ